MTTMDRNVRCNINALNIADYEERCHRHLFLRKPKKQKIFWLLKSLAFNCKTMTEVNGVECDVVSPALHVLKDLPSSLLVDMTDAKKLKYMYFKIKMLDYLETDVIFNEYAKFIKRLMETSLMGSSKFETLLKKYAFVCSLLHPRPELSIEEVHQYELTAELLKICYDMDVQNSKLIVALLKTTLDWYVDDVFTGPVRQPSYPDGFLKYILHHSFKESFDLQCHCMERPRTLWEFASKLSVTDAVSVGNSNRTLCLLQHGVEAFTENDVDSSSRRFPFISKYLPRGYLMTLHMMSRIHSVNSLIQTSSQILQSRLDTATNDQKKCVNLIWRSIMDPFVKNTELDLAINSEYLFFASRKVENLVPYKENMALCDLYENSFKDMAVCPSEPRSLKHLSRCAIRNNLKQGFSLPKGVSQLGLSRQLEDYVNLECD